MNPQEKPFVDHAASANVARAMAEMNSVYAAEDLQSKEDALEIAKFVAMTNAHKLNSQKHVVESGAGMEQIQIGPDGKPLRMRGDVDPNELYKKLAGIAEHNARHSSHLPVPTLVGTLKNAPNQAAPQRPNNMVQSPVATPVAPQPVVASPQAAASSLPLLKADSQLEMVFDAPDKSNNINPLADITKEQEALKQKIQGIETKLDKMDSIEQMLKILIQQKQ